MVVPLLSKSQSSLTGVSSSASEAVNSHWMVCSANSLKLVIGKTLTMGLQQFLNIVLINILQFCFIGQFGNVVDDCFLVDFLLVLLMQFGVTSFQAAVISMALIML
jgi:hypothetical protein